MSVMDDLVEGATLRGRVAGATDALDALAGVIARAQAEGRDTAVLEVLAAAELAVRGAVQDQRDRLDRVLHGRPS